MVDHNHQSGSEPRHDVSLHIDGFTTQEIELLRKNDKLVEQETRAALHRVLQYSVHGKSLTIASRTRQTAGKAAGKAAKKTFAFVRYFQFNPRLSQNQDQTKSEVARSQTDRVIPPTLARFVKTIEPNFETLTIKNAAELLAVAPNTLKTRIQQGKVLAWKGVKSGYIIPAEQFTERRTVLAGVEDVIDILGDAEIAWTFLTRQYPFGDTVERPLDRLKRKLVSDVTSAAKGYGTDFT